MPMYEFICQGCQAEFEELVFSAEEEVACPSCQSVDIKKKIALFAFKSSGKFVSAQQGGSSCSGCTPGPGGCAGCH